MFGQKMLIFWKATPTNLKIGKLSLTFSNFKFLEIIYKKNWLKVNLIHNKKKTYF